VGRAAAWAERLAGSRGGQAGQGGEMGLGCLRGSSPFLFFSFFYFSKPFSIRILNTINFKPKSHSTK